VTPFSGVGSVPCMDCLPDSVNGFNTVRELYEASNDKFNKFTVPVLWDKKTSTIVNNESSEIIEMFATALYPLGTQPNEFPDLFPADLALRELVDRTNAWVYTDINNGVYRCGFAQTQEAYEEAVGALYDALDRLEAILSKQRYLCSASSVTVADVRLFVTLVRFDEVYVVYFKARQRLPEHTQLPARALADSGVPGGHEHGPHQEPLLHLPRRAQ